MIDASPFVCPRCGAVSHNPHDAAERYCGRCYMFEDRVCCLCGSPYERLGNNPSPLAPSGRCCDACNEVVIEARIDPAGLAFELERVEDAMLRIGPDQLRQAALAAICASRGPVLWAQRQRERAQLDEVNRSLPAVPGPPTAP